MAVFLAGCGGPEVDDVCGWLDADVGESGDTLVSLSHSSRVMLSNAGGKAALVRVREGQTAFRSFEPDCEPSAEQPCTYELSALRVILSGFSIGELSVSDYGLLLQGPVRLEDHGAGLDLMGVTSMKACARFDGELTAATEVQLHGGVASVDAADQVLDLAFSYDAEFELNSGPPIVEQLMGSARVELAGDLSAAGERPWLSR